MANLDQYIPSSSSSQSFLTASLPCGEEAVADVRIGFDEVDQIWRTENGLRPAKLFTLVLELTTAVIPGTIMYCSIAVWNLALPYSLLGAEPFAEWPSRVQWAYIINEIIFDCCCSLFMPMLLPFVFRSPAEAKGLGLCLNILLTACVPAYLLTMKHLSPWDPLSAPWHLPLNVHFAVMLWINAAAVGLSGGADSGQARWWTTLMTGLPFFLPIALCGLLQYLLPAITLPRRSSLELGLFGSVGVPMIFTATQIAVRRCCMQLMHARRHPGEVSRLMVMALMLESFGRRLLICSITEPSFAFAANFVVCALDTIVQVTVDARDAVLLRCFCRRTPGEHFEHQGRRRLRADALILHVLSEHLAILSLSTLEFAMRLIMLQQPLTLAASQYALCVLEMLPVRILFDIITFALENRCGYITRRCFQLERWHGIAVLEVWQRRKGELMRLLMIVAFLAASYEQFYIIPLFKRALV